MPAATNVVRLVPRPKQHRHARKRPYDSYYYASEREKDKYWLKIGHSSTPVGALRAAVSTIERRKAERVDIYDEGGYLIKQVVRVPSGHVHIRNYD